MNPDKQAFLHQQHHPPVIVADAADLSGDWVTDVQTDKRVRLMPVDIFTAGPPCVQKSKLNRNPPPENATCIQTGTGPTGTGFSYVIQYCKAHHPRLVVVENVKLDVGADTSESDHVVHQFQLLGYAVKKLVLDARDYGSFVPRPRMYFVCVHGALDVEN